MALDPVLGASDGKFDVAIDRSNMIWITKPEQAAIFAGIKTMGVRWFRDAFAYPLNRTADFIDVVRQAKQAGEKLCGWPGGLLKPSKMNLSKFKIRLRGLLDGAKARGLEVDAFEIGNKVEWVGFNGDVPYGLDASPEDVLIAARGYARFLEAAAEAVRAGIPRAKLITFGIAHIDDTWDKPPRHHLPNPAAFVASLRSLDGKNYLSNPRYRIDGYG